MTSGDEGAAPAVRLWWALPVGLVVVMAVVFVAVVLPALASGPSVPSQLVVHRSPAPAPAVTTPSASVSPHPTRTTTVVPPDQPVVRESDDRGEKQSANGSGEPNDR